MKAGILCTGLLGVAASFAMAKPAHAVEGALGRTITGTNITSYAGVVPPTPGFTMGMGYVHYSGDIGADRQVPVNNLLTLGLDATFDMFSLTGVYVWDAGEAAGTSHRWPPCRWPKSMWMPTSAWGRALARSATAMDGDCSTRSSRR